MIACTWVAANAAHTTDRIFTVLRCNGGFASGPALEQKFGMRVFLDTKSYNFNVPTQCIYNAAYNKQQNKHMMTGTTTRIMQGLSEFIALQLEHVVSVVILHQQDAWSHIGAVLTSIHKTKLQ